MSRRDAFGEEMSQDLQTFTRAMRETLPERPDPRRETALVKQLAQTARADQDGLGEAAAVPVPVPVAERVRWRLHRAWRSPRLLPARIAIATGLLAFSMAGLAVAGVKLPEPVNSALDEVGVTLPNQADDDGADGTPARDDGDDGSPGQGKGHDKSKDEDKPGRRVRRHGTGPLPGPASPPEGNALGHTKDKPGRPDRPNPPDPPAGAKSKGGSKAVGKGRPSSPGDRGRGGGPKSK